MKDMTVGCKTLILKAGDMDHFDPLLNHILDTDHSLDEMIWFSYSNIDSTNTRINQPFTTRSIARESGTARFHGTVHDQLRLGSFVLVFLFNDMIHTTRGGSEGQLALAVGPSNDKMADGGQMVGRWSLARALNPCTVVRARGTSFWCGNLWCMLTQVFHLLLVQALIECLGVTRSGTTHHQVITGEQCLW